LRGLNAISTRAIGVPMLEITPTIPESQRQRAGEIYYEAFRRKLQPLVGKPAETLRVLTAGLNLKLALGASVDGKLFGVAGLHHRLGVFSRVVLRDSLSHLGPVRGLYAWAVLNLFGAGATCPPDHLRIAALAVDARARGHGLGSRLLEAIFEKARCEGFRAVRLEVVDTNTGARQLYERSGFVVVETHSYPIKNDWLGFSSDHVMVRML
jgi:ribosomal protein S18 acetylase RimI-like enzyme